jgi:hypothetical protein
MRARAFDESHPGRLCCPRVYPVEEVRAADPYRALPFLAVLSPPADEGTFMQCSNRTPTLRGY